MSQKARWEYFKAIYERYHKADRKVKHVIFERVSPQHAL